MGSVPSESISQQLAALSQRLETLPEATEPPMTTLQVLGRSRREAYWQRMLVYFLTPTKPHGLDHDLLEHLLTALEAHALLDFSYSRLDLEGIRLEQEVSTERGRPDLVIWSPDWFICVELKVDSSEGTDQTRRYVDVESFDEIDLGKDDVSPEGQHYVYLAPEETQPPAADEFASVSWGWLASEFQSFLAGSRGQYPSRTVAQLNDFVDTIQNELTMTEYQENRREKIALAIEHYEPMTEVLETLDSYVDELRETWPDWFLDAAPAGWDEQWHVRMTGKSYNSVHRDEWAINYPGDESNNKHSDLHIYWEFRISEQHIGRGEVSHQITLTGQNDDLKSSFRENFYASEVQDELQTSFAERTSDSDKDLHRSDWDGNTYERIVEGTYPFTFEDGSGFEKTVVEAFEDLQPTFAMVTDCVPDQ